MIYRTRTGATFEVAEGMFKWLIKYEKDGMVDYLNAETDDRETAEIAASNMAIIFNEGYLIGKGEK